MTNGQPHSTLRDLRQHMLRPVTGLVCAGVAGVLTIAGPFGTLDTLGGGGRLLYWGIVVGLTYAAGFGISAAIRNQFTGQLSRGAVIGITALASGAGITVTVALVNLLAFGLPDNGADWMGMVGTVFPVASLISVIFEVVADHIRPPVTAQETGAQQTGTPPAPPILDRVPLDKRGGLVALSVEDHYVRITTSKGQMMVLMRLADAIRETGTTPGQQVHRSHWVALDAVTAARRTGDNAVLTLSTGDQIPVSRRYIPAIKEAGLLPR